MSKIKKDISSFPFQLIEQRFQELYSSQKEDITRHLTAVKLNRLKRYVGEQVDDSLPDTVVTELAPAEDQKLKQDCNEQAVSEFVEVYNIADSWSFLAHQLLAHLAKYELPSSKNISAKDYLRLNATSDREKGIWRMITRVSRGKLMSKQVDPAHLPVCGLVPIYMAAQKKYNGIPYSAWNKDEVSLLVDADLEAAMFVDPEDYETALTLGSEQLLEIRKRGLAYKNKAGQIAYRNPQTYHALTNITDTPVHKLPRYAKAMLCQIWCAHPSNRHEYMILDPYNWDNMPKPLIDDTPIPPPTPTKPFKARVESPWD